jgi:hypothetical protein
MWVGVYGGSSPAQLSSHLRVRHKQSGGRGETCTCKQDGPHTCKQAADARQWYHKSIKMYAESKLTRKPKCGTG